MVQVAIFVNKAVDELEDVINEWLKSNHNYEIVKICQAESDSCWTISIWYTVNED